MKDEPALKEFRKKFQLDALTITENTQWILSVRPGQLTLGSMVASSKQGALSFAELDPDSGNSLISMLANAENAAKDLYGAVRVNVICLMMQDPVVHFHILPRYELKIVRYATEWIDEDWPGPPVFRAVQTPEKTLSEIKDDLRSRLNNVPG